MVGYVSIQTSILLLTNIFMKNELFHHLRRWLQAQEVRNKHHSLTPRTCFGSSEIMPIKHFKL